MTHTNMGAYADITARALNIIETGAHLDPIDPNHPDVLAVTARALVLTADPYARYLIAPCVGLLVHAAQQLAAATGDSPAEIVAGWRKLVAAGMNVADELGATP